MTVLMFDVKSHALIISNASGCEHLAGYVEDQIVETGGVLGGSQVSDHGIGGTTRVALEHHRDDFAMLLV